MSTWEEDADALAKGAVDTAKIMPDDAPRLRGEIFAELFGMRRAPWMIQERVLQIRERIRAMPERPDAAAIAFSRDNPEAFRRRFPRPEWGTYAAYITATIHEAIALSCDVEPTSIHGGGMFTTAFPEYFRRWKIAINHARVGALPNHGFDNETPHQTVVGLKAFVLWAKTNPVAAFTFPAEFPFAEANHTATVVTPKDEKPLSTKERTSHLVVIAALAKKAGIDPAQPTVAAKAIVETARDQLGVKIGARTVEEILKKLDEALDRRDP